MTIITGQQAPQLMNANAQVRIHAIVTRKKLFGRGTFKTVQAEWNRPDINDTWRTVPDNSKQAIGLAKYCIDNQIAI